MKLIHLSRKKSNNLSLMKSGWIFFSFWAVKTNKKNICLNVNLEDESVELCANFHSESWLDVENN